MSSPFARYTARTYAVLTTPSHPARSSRLKTVSLDHFLQRQRVIGLWRQVVRATNKIQMENTRVEMRAFAREEFERNRHVEDLGHIRYLISTGTEQFKSMGRYVDEMGRR